MAMNGLLLIGFSVLFDSIIELGVVLNLFEVVQFRKRGGGYAFCALNFLQTTE